MTQSTLSTGRPVGGFRLSGGHPAARAAVRRAMQPLLMGQLYGNVVVPGQLVSRPSRWAGFRRQRDELVTVSLVGPVRAVTAMARALATVVVVTGMSHHVTDGPRCTGPIRFDVTCYPPKRIDIKRLQREEDEKARIINGSVR
jgi:hypothetical protein